MASSLNLGWCQVQALSIVCYRWNFIKCNCAGDEESVLQALREKIAEIMKRKMFIKGVNPQSSRSPTGDHL